MSLDDALGVGGDDNSTIPPQSILNDLITQRMPGIADSQGNVDPQSVLNRLIRHGMERGRAPAPQGTTSPQEQPDFSRFGNENGAPPMDFSQFGEEDPNEVAKRNAGLGFGGNVKAALKAVPRTMGEQVGQAMQSVATAAPPSLESVIAATDAGGMSPPMSDEMAAQVKQSEKDYLSLPPEQRFGATLYKGGQAVEHAAQAIPMTPAEQQSVGGQVGSTLGGMVTPALLTMVGSVLGGPAGGIAGAGAGAGLFAASSAASQYKEAKENGATNEEAAYAASQAGGEMGALAMLPLGAVLKPFARDPGMVGWAIAKLKQAAVQGATFTGIGEAQAYLHSEIEKLYEPEFKAKLQGELDTLKANITAASANPQTDPKWLKQANEGVKAYEEAIEQVGKYKFDPTRIAASGISGAILGILTPSPLRQQTPPPPPPGTPPPGTGAPPPGPQPQPGTGPERGLPPPGGGGGETTPPETPGPFETKLKPNIRSTLQDQAINLSMGEAGLTDTMGRAWPQAERDAWTAKRQSIADDIATWDDDKLKGYVNEKTNGPGQPRDDDAILRQYGLSDDEIKAMSPEDKKAKADEAIRNGTSHYEPPPAGSAENPVDLKNTADVARAAARANQDHTPAQGEANNVARGHATWNGLDITIEAPPGGVRRGVAPDGQPFETQHPHAYGYFTGLAAGADGMHPDVTIGDHPGAPTVYVLDEIDPKTGAFRQTKSFVGFQTWQDAVESYLGITTKDRSQLGGMRAFSRDQFLELARRGGLSEPVSETMAHKGAIYNDGNGPGTAGGAGGALKPENGAERTTSAAEPVKPTPEQHKAIEDALTAVGVPPHQVRPVDIARAAEIHANEGLSPADAFQVAVLRSAVEDGLMTLHDVRNDHNEEIAHAVESGLASERGVRAAPRGAATGGATTAGAGERVRGGGAHGAPAAREQGTASAEPGEGAEAPGAETVRANGGAGAAGHPEAGAADQQRPAGGERTAETDDGGLGGEGAEHGTGDAASETTGPSAHVRQGGQPFGGMIDNQDKYRQAAKKRREDAAGGGGALKVFGTDRGRLRAQGKSVEAANAEREQQVAKASKQFDADMTARKISADTVPQDIRKVAIDYTIDLNMPPIEALDLAFEQAERQAIQDEGLDAVLKEWDREDKTDVGTAREEHPQGAVEAAAQAEEPGAAETDDEPGHGTVAPAGGGGRPAGERSEHTAAGEQHVLPGAERISDAELAKRKSEQPLRPKAEQKPADQGLFSDEGKQADLVDQARKPAVAPGEGAEHWWDHELTTAGRFDLLKQIGIKKPPRVQWRHLEVHERAKLLTQRPPSAPEKIPGTRAIAQRIVNAEDNFANTLVEMGKISHEDAQKLTSFYLKKKLAKLDPVGGRITVKHGGYLNPDAIQRVLAMMRAAELPKGKSDWTEIGKNEIGQTLYEDQRGVRSYIENGVRRSEPVPIVPTRAGVQAVTPEHRDEWRLTSEIEKTPEKTPEKPTALAGPEIKLAQALMERIKNGEPHPATDLAGHFRDYFAAGKRFNNILAARRFAKEHGFDADPKAIEEAIEFAVVQRGRDIARKNKTQDGAFDDLLKLYQAQPVLGTRTSTSMREQAYSTPAPLGFVASRLARVSSGKSVFEPTAGNGALLLEADPALTVANEINPQRAENLRSQGFTPTEKDAAELRLTGNKEQGFDVVLANPPFGPVRDGGESKVFDLSDIQPGYSTTEIDHAIALRALAGMKDDGRAALIIGGLNKQLVTEKARGDAYNGQAKRRFFKALYDRYNVTDHFTVAGELYSRQGAAWPVDVLVINGRGKSARALPSLDVPRIYSSWSDLKGVLDEPHRNDAQPVTGPDVGSPAGEPGPGRGNGGVQPSVGGQPVGSVAGNGQSEHLSERPVQQRNGNEAGAPSDQQRGGPGERGNAERPGDETPSPLSDFDSAFDSALDDVFGKDEAGPSGVTKAQAEEDGALAAARGDDSTPPYPPEAFDPQATKAFKEGHDKANGNGGARAKPNDERTAGETAAEAAEHIGKGADKAMEALVQMFGGGKTFGMGLNVDPDMYAKAKPLFTEAAKEFFKGASDLRDLLRKMVAYMQRVYQMTREVLERMKPYLQKFMDDVYTGVVKLTEEAKTAFKRAEPNKRETETEGQVSYRPQSDAPALGTLVPKNMRTSIEESLARIEAEHGNVDNYVAKELGYTLPEMADAFAAEQVDALALALHNISEGNALVLGDQTGIGKGRVNAGVIRWAIKNNHVPIFVTEKPNLYKDMYRDLSDIGIQNLLGREPRIVMTNSGEKVPLDDEGKIVLKSPDSAAHKAQLEALSGANFNDKHDVVFTTYNQMQTVAGKDTPRRQFLQRLAPHAVLIFDESHNAGGQKLTREKPGAAENRAKFARSLISRARGVLYSSATYAKRPDVMDLYAATDMAMAVEKIENLGEAIAHGGVPMQQAVASMLAKAGQYVRRERSFDGVNYDTPSVPVDKAKYDGIAKSMATINDFSHLVKAAVQSDEFQSGIRGSGQAIARDDATGDSGVTSINFTSIMHNIINQMLLSMKAEPASQMALDAIKRNEKPVLTVANTLETFLKDTADNLHMKVGDALKSDFRDILQKYLDRTRTVTIKPPFEGQDPIKHVLSDEELGPRGVAAYNAAKAQIRALDLADLPVSPIDYMKNRLKQAGHSVGEITGRGLTLDYGAGKTPVLTNRAGRELSIAGRNKTISDFNNGNHDALVLNQAGATGLSAHAGEKFKDQRQRHMMIVQAEGNIDTHMQMLGRVHRTGQVVVPTYSQLVADIPAEKRPAAVLAKKMASLNANTTASRSSAMTAKDVPDFINQYGDRIAANYAVDNPETHWQMGAPVKFDEGGAPKLEDAMRKLTGRVMLLPLKMQEEVYDHLEDEYKALIEQMDAAGENALEAKHLDLKAKPIERTEVVGEKNESGSPFAAPVVMEKTKVNRLGKPFSPEEVVQKALDEIDAKRVLGDSFALTPENAAKTLDRVNYRNQPAYGARDPLTDLARKVHSVNQEVHVQNRFEDYKRGVLHEIADPDRMEKERAKLDAVKDRWTGLDAMFNVGARIYLKTASGNIRGVVIKAPEQKGTPKNPLALSTWKVTVAIPDASRQLHIPFSRIYESGRAPADDSMAIEAEPLHNWTEPVAQTLDYFAHGQKETKEDRYIATGNLLAAYDWLSHRGQIIHYTDEAGNVRQGILTARDWNLREHAKTKPRILNNPNEIVDWLRKKKGETMWSADNVVRLKSDQHSPNYYYIEIEGKKNTGGQYYLDKELTGLTGDFFKQQGVMRVGFNDQGDKLVRIVGRLQQLGAKFGIPADIPKAEPVEGFAQGDAGQSIPQSRTIFDRIGESLTRPAPFTKVPRVPMGKQAQDYVVSKGIETGDEHLIAVDHKGNTVIGKWGGPVNVPLNKDEMRQLDDPNAKIVVHHNHPLGAGFSPPDIGMLGSPGLEALWAHGHNGNVARIALTPQAKVFLAKNGTPTQVRNALFQMANAAQRSVYDVVQRAILDNRVSMDGALAVTAEIGPIAFARAGLVDYRTNADVSHIIENLGLEPYIQKAAQAAQEMLHARGYEPGLRDDRPAEPLRHAGDVGASFASGRSIARFSGEQEGAGAVGPGLAGNETARPPPEQLNPGFAAPNPGYQAIMRARDYIHERISDFLDSERGIKAIEGLSDYSHRMRLFQDQVEALHNGWVSPDGRLPDARQFYTLKRLFPGKRADRIDVFNREHFDPLVKFMRSSGLTEKMAGDYLYAKHAVERNIVKAQLYRDDPNHQFQRALRDPDVVGASGMSASEARRIVREAETGPKAAQFAELRGRAAGIKKWIGEELLRGGLESPQNLAEQARTYSDYVPLKEWDDPEDVPENVVFNRGPGRGDIRGHENQYAFGRRSKADNPLAHLVAQAYRAVTRAERNKVLISLAQSLQDLKGAGVNVAAELGVRGDHGRPVKKIDPRTGLAVTVANNWDQFGDNAVKYKFKGAPRYLIFDNQDLARAVKTWSPTQLGGFLYGFQWITNKMKSLWTHYSPDFMARHTARYYVESVANAMELKETGQHAVGQHARLALPIVGKATRAIFKVEAGETPAQHANSDPEMADVMRSYQLMKAHGGMMALRTMRDIDQIKEDLRVRLNDMGRATTNPIKVFHDAIESLNHVTSIMDNAQRLATFHSALKQGMSPQAAALKARDATIDYQFRGLWSNMLGIWEPFFNTALRTGFRLGGAVSRSKIMRRVALATMAMGLAASAWNYLVGGNDKDGVPFFDKIPSYEKNKAMILLLPWSTDAKGRPNALKFPFPYNWAAPLSFGYGMGNFMWGSEKASTVIKDMFVKPLVSTFSQIGEEGIGWRSAFPEVVRPGYDIGVNEDWTGKPIHNDPRYQKGPNAYDGKRDIGGNVRTGEGWKWIAQALNGVSGGDARHSGYLDFYPEDIREVINAFVGSEVNFVRRGMQVVGAGAAGEAPESSDVPVGHIFFGQDYDASDRYLAFQRHMATQQPWK